MLAAVEADLGAVSAAEPRGSVYDRCRLNERRALFLRRYWQYFATKWDQRDDIQLGPALRAAEEIVWSCWAAELDAAGAAAPEPAPLPYVEPWYTPRAIPRSTPPPDLQETDPLLQRR